jgi:hypothetical protein
MEKCNTENQYDKVDKKLPKVEKSNGKSQDDIEGKITNAKSGVQVTSRDLGNQGELIFRLKFDKSNAATDMVGDLGTNNRYYWKELQSVLDKMNAETPDTPDNNSVNYIVTEPPPDNAVNNSITGEAAPLEPTPAQAQTPAPDEPASDEPTPAPPVDSDKAAKEPAAADKKASDAQMIENSKEKKKGGGTTFETSLIPLITRWLAGTGGSTNRRYSFKKLPKHKRANKTNKTQAKRGKRLNRSKKMSR